MGRDEGEQIVSAGSTVIPSYHVLVGAVVGGAAAVVVVAPGAAAVVVVVGSFIMILLHDEQDVDGANTT